MKKLLSITLTLLLAGAASTLTRASAASPVFDPMDYNAVGDCATDDTTAVQAAVTALNTAGGGTLLLSRCFVVSGSGTEILLFTTPVRIVGLGWNTGLKVAATSSNSTPVIRIKPTAPPNCATTVPATPYASNGAAIVNFAITPQSSGTGGHAIFLDGSAAGNCGFFRNLKIDHIFVGQLHTSSWGVTGANGSNPNGVPGPASTIRNSEFRRGIQLNSNGDTVEIATNRFSGPGTAIEVTNVSGGSTLRIVHNNIISAGGVWIKGPQTGVDVIGNIMELVAASDTGEQNEGIDPFGHDNAILNIDGTEISNVRVVANVVSNRTGSTLLDGVRLNGVTRGQVAYNYIFVRGTRNNVVGTASCTDIEVRGNRFVGPSVAATDGKQSFTNQDVFFIGHAAIHGGTSEFLNLMSNLYYDGTNWRTRITGASSIIAQGAGTTTTYGQASVTKDGAVTLVPRFAVQLSGSVHVHTAGKGVILKAAGGGCWEITISNAGVLVPVPIACP